MADSTKPRGARKKALSRLQSGVLFGRIAAASMFGVVITDLGRRAVRGEPILLTVAPAALVWGGALWVILMHGTQWIPPLIRRGLSFLTACLFLTLLVAVSQKVPGAQIGIGIVALASPGPCVILGLAVAQSERGFRVFKRAVLFILALSILVALLQQFGLLKADVFNMLEEARSMRGLQSGGVFAYTSGPFRTANVFAFFLAVGGAILIEDLSDKAPHRKGSGFNLKEMGLLLAIVLSSVLTARRTGLSMLLGAVVPALFRAKGSSIKVVAVFAVVVVVVVGIGQFRSFESGDLRLKVMHVTSESHTSSRFSDAFDVKEADWEIVTFTGGGLGSHGAARAFGGSSRSAHSFAEEHRITHVGWFKDLLAYGVIGMLLHLAWFMSLLIAAVTYGRRQSKISRWSAAGFLSMAIVNYYFVATSWIQGLTGGLFFGLLTGVLLGRLMRSSR